MGRISVNQLALSQVLDRFAQVPDDGAEALEVVQLRASAGILEVIMVDYGIDGQRIVRPHLSTRVSLPCSEGELVAEVELDAFSRLLRCPQAGADVSTVSLSTLDAVDLLVEQFRPGPLPGFEATISYNQPLVPAPVYADWTPYLTMNGEKFVKRLGLVLPAMAHEKGDRAELAAVTMHGGRMSATDRHRLHVAGEAAQIMNPVLIPAQHARELPELLAGSKMVELSVNQKKKLLSIKTLFGDFPYEIVVGICDNAPPSIEHITGQLSPNIITVNGPALAELLQRAIDVVGDQVRIAIRDRALDVLAGEVVPDQVILRQEIRYEVERPPPPYRQDPRDPRYTIHINASYLLAALGAAQGPVELYFADVDKEEAPSYVEAIRVVSPDLVAIVMPRRP